MVTLGCPIGENVAGVDYHQYLGLFDALGQLNAWGHWPEYWPPTWHSTNARTGALRAKSGPAGCRGGREYRTSAHLGGEPNSRNI